METDSSPVSLLISMLTLSDQGSTLTISFNLNQLTKTLPPNALKMGVGASVYDFWAITIDI